MSGPSDQSTSSPARPTGGLGAAAPSPEVLRSSLRSTCDPYLGKLPFWLFAYGSLIWRPECPSVEVCRAQLRGYHRGLYLWSDYHRGTSQMPGLVLGLDEGGCCSGMAYRLPEQDIHTHLEALWFREMVTPCYQPKWLECTLEDGRAVLALTFVLHPQRPYYAGLLPDGVLRQVFRHARGISGSTLEYVEQTASVLRQLGMPDLDLEAMLKRCLPSE